MTAIAPTDRSWIRFSPIWLAMFVLTLLFSNGRWQLAVENGFWLLRPADDGLSVIASPQGHAIASEHDADLESRVFSGQVPVARNDTIYPEIGPYLPFAAGAFLAGSLFSPWRQRPTR